MYNGLEGITEQLSNSEQSHKSFEVLLDAPRDNVYNAMWFQVLEDYPYSAHQLSQIWGMEYKNLLMSVWFSSKCYEMKQLG